MRKILSIVMGLMLVSSLAFATAYLDQVQDYSNLPSNATSADVRMVAISGDQMAYTTFWFPVRFTRPADAVVWGNSVFNYNNLPTGDAAHTCRYVINLKQIFMYHAGAWAVLQPEAVSSATVTSVGGVTAGSTVVAGTGITSTTGNIVATAGSVSAGTTITAGTGISATAGNVVAAAGALGAKTARIYAGAQVTRDTVRAEVGTAGGIGSIYCSTGGKVYIKVANADATADWQLVTASAAD